MDLIESEKENIQPLREGRVAASLEIALKGAAKDVLSEERKALAALCKSGTGEDAFAAHYNYLKFSEQHCLSGDPDFLGFLERAIRLVKGTPKFNQDKRYVWIWLRLAKHTPSGNSLAVFRYMEERNIGTTFAVFYEQYADLLTSLERYKLDQVETEKGAMTVTFFLARHDDARGAIDLGINRGARPIGRLRRKKKSLRSPTAKICSDLDSKHSASGNPFFDIGSFTARPKEDVKSSTAWSRVTIPQKQGNRDTLGPRTRIEVFEDQESNVQAASLAAERIMCSMDMLTDSDGEMVSFEESRAMHLHNIVSSKNCASPTIHTKAALADVLEMFSQPLQTDASIQGQSVVGEDETISGCLYKLDGVQVGVFNDSTTLDDNHTTHVSVPNPCDPADAGVVEAILRHIKETGLYDVPNLIFRLDSKTSWTSKAEDQLRLGADERRNYLKKGEFNEGDEIDVCNFPFRVLGKVGEGSFGKVYLVRDAVPFDVPERRAVGDWLMDDLSTCRTVVKLQDARSPWEYWAISRLRERISQRLAVSIIRPISCVVTANETFLHMPRGKGTLLDCVNFATARGGKLDEALAAFWAVEILRTLEGIHQNGFIHGDVKLDNCLFRCGFEEQQEDWEKIYRQDGKGGWSEVGITLIDWGNSLDLRLFENGQKFISEPGGDPSILCWEARNRKAWTYEKDWYGAAGAIHVLLFGKYMEVSESESAKGERPTLRPAAKVPRYYQAHIWDKTFEVLLNAFATAEIREVRLALEEWLTVISRKNDLRRIIWEMKVSLDKNKE